MRSVLKELLLLQGGALAENALWELTKRQSGRKRASCARSLKCRTSIVHRDLHSPRSAQESSFVMGGFLTSDMDDTEIAILVLYLHT